MRKKVGQEATEEMSALKGVVNLFIVVLLRLSRPRYIALEEGRGLQSGAHERFSGRVGAPGRATLWEIFEAITWKNRLGR